MENIHSNDASPVKSLENKYYTIQLPYVNDGGDC